MESTVLISICLYLHQLVFEPILATMGIAETTTLINNCGLVANMSLYDCDNICNREDENEHGFGFWKRELGVLKSRTTEAMVKKVLGGKEQPVEIYSGGYVWE